MIGYMIFNKLDWPFSELVLINSSALLSLSLAFAFLSFIALLPHNIFTDSRSGFSFNQSIRISIARPFSLSLREQSLLVVNF